HQAHEQQLPGHNAENDHGQHQQQRVAHEHEQAGLHELGHRVDVGGHAADDHAGLLAVVERHGESLQMVEDSQPQVAEEPFADETDQHDLGSIDEIGGGRHHDVEHDRAIERG